MAADLLRIKALHPTWNIVDIEVAPNGGIWAMGADGGMFALNSEGGTTGITAPLTAEGTPFSYTGLAPEQRQGTRSFTDLQKTDTGYTMVSNIPGQTYAFNTAPLPSAPAAGAAPPAGDAPAAGTPDASGRDVFINSMIAMGFSREQATSLGGTLWTSSKTKTADALYVDLISSNEYAQRFPGMKAMREQGIAMNESQYINFERSYKNIARSAGLPEGFYDDPSDFGKLIAAGVSPDEYGSRIQWAQTTALSDPTFLDELAREVPGANLGDATAFFLDPEMGTKKLEEKVIRANYGAAARRSTFGTLTSADKDLLQARGVTTDQAEAGFATLGAGVMANTVEESLSDDQFTQAEGVGFVAEAGKGGAATNELNTRRARRAAQFGGGGGAGGGGAGKTGLGGS